MAALLSERAQSKPNTLIARLFDHAERNPAHDAVVTSKFKLSYAQLAQLVQAQAKRLVARNRSGEVIGIKCADDTQHLISCLAAICTGSRSCTIPTYEQATTQDLVIRECGVTHVIDENEVVDPMSVGFNTMEGRVGKPFSDTPSGGAQLLFSTSGTTGVPKRVVHQDSDLVEQAHRHIGSEQERFACIASMEHNFAKRHRLYCVAVGATNVFLDADPESVAAQCQSLGANVLHVSAFQAQELLVAHNIGSLSNIRLKLGGSHVPITLRHQLRNNITRNIQAGYGTTETGAIAFTDPNDTEAGESVGQALPGIEIRAVNSERMPLGTEERGELAVSCEGMFREYFGRPDLSEAKLADGWFYTGDIGYLDREGRIYLCGRADDMFMFNSMNIFPQDIESQICQYPSVIDAVVLPKTSSVHGNIPIALIVMAEGEKPDIAALSKFVRSQVGVRSPRHYTVVDEIPRNATGKIFRDQAISLSTKSEQIRHTIVNALDSVKAGESNPALISAFAKGEQDVSLQEIGVDSLARMELLVALEMAYDTVISLSAFGQFRTLGDIVSSVLSALSSTPLEQELQSVQENLNATSLQTQKGPDVVSFFQRIFRYCHTVAQLNKALYTLGNRITPQEIECLGDWHRRRQLIPNGAADKFHKALKYWFEEMKSMMLSSGKEQAESFVSHRITCTATHFIGPGRANNKTLLVCFSGKGGRGLMMPNVVLMQHTDSLQYDLLVISEPLNVNYRLGVPLLGKNVTEVVSWIAGLDFIDDYKQIRVLGCSAGGFPAIIAAYYLNAEMALSVGCRFHSHRHPLRNFERVLLVLLALRKGRRSRIQMSYPVGLTRDRNFARLISWLTHGTMVPVKFDDEKVEHNFLQRLVERGELAAYLERTIFVDMSKELISKHRLTMPMSFPIS